MEATATRPKRTYTRRKPITAKPAKAAPETVGDILEALPPVAGASGQQTATNFDAGPFAPQRAATVDRSPLREPLRDEDPRAAADRKAKEWFAHVDSLPDGQDKYYIDPNKIPDGWTYEWKTHEVLGKQDPQYQVALAQTAWQAVPASRHREMMPSGFRGETIDIGGMRLMERPQQITDYQKAKERRNAQAPIDNLRAKLGAAPAGQFERGTNPGAPVSIKTTIEKPASIPSG